MDELIIEKSLTDSIFGPNNVSDENIMQQLADDLDTSIKSDSEVENLDDDSQDAALAIEENLKDDLVIIEDSKTIIATETNFDDIKNKPDITFEDTKLNFQNDNIFQEIKDDFILPKKEKKKIKSKKEIEEEEREKMQVLVSNFTEEQLDRYEMYRRAAFPKAAVKRLMQTITGCSVSQNVVIAMSGITKVFVGEIVETALDYMDELNETGPLQPKHLREAVRRLRQRNKIPNAKNRKNPLFKI